MRNLQQKFHLLFKPFLLIGICLTIFISSKCFGQLEFSLNNDSILKAAQVKTEIYYSFFSPTDSAIYCINNYDINGNITSSKTFTKNGKLLKADTLIYNSKHELTKKIFFNKSGEILTTNEYSYDSLGNCTSVKEFDHLGKNSCSSSYTFNTKGNVLFTKQITKNKNYFKTAQYFYDNNDNLEKVISLRYNGDSTIEIYSYINHLYNSIISTSKQLKKIEHYNYDDGGRLTEITVTTTTFKKNKTEFKKLYFEYEGKGLVSQRLTYEEDGLDEKTKCYYTFY